MTRAFDFEIRVLCCLQCGAPVDVPLEGGEVVCDYCRSPMTVERRKPAVDAAAATGDEEERLESLRRQQHTPPSELTYSLRRVPPGLEEFSRLRSFDEGSVERLEEAWRDALARLSADDGSATEHEIWWLGSLLSQHLGATDHPRRRRAVLETCAERLSDPGYQHMVYAELARAAVHLGDATSGEGWLGRCTPDPADLSLDSAWRLGRASVARARGRLAEVLNLVGPHPGATPVAPHDALLFAAYRIDALEGLGRLAQAWTVFMGATRDARYGPAVKAALASNRFAPRTLARTARIRRFVLGAVAFVAVAAIVGVVVLAVT